MTLSENRSLWLTNIVNTNEEEINKLVAIADRTDLTAIKNTNLPGIYKDGYLSGIPIPVLDKEAINKRSETIHNKIQKRAEKKAEIKLTGPCINSLAAFLNENDVPFKAIVPTSIFYSMVNACPNFFRFEKFVNDSIVVVAERFNKWVMESYSTEAKKVLALLASTNNCLEKFKNDFTFFELGFDDFAERLSKGYSIRKHDIYNAPESTIKEAFTKFSRCFEIGHSTWREIGGIDRFIKTFFPPMITNPKDLHAILHNCRSVTSAEFDLRHTTKGDTSIAYLQMRLILPKTSDTDKEILRKIHEKLNNYDNKGLKKGNPDTEGKRVVEHYPEKKLYIIGDPFLVADEKAIALETMPVNLTEWIQAMTDPIACLNVVIKDESDVYLTVILHNYGDLGCEQEKIMVEALVNEYKQIGKQLSDPNPLS